MHSHYIYVYSCLQIIKSFNPLFRLHYFTSASTVKISFYLGVHQSVWSQRIRVLPASCGSQDWLESILNRIRFTVAASVIVIIINQSTVVIHSVAVMSNREKITCWSSVNSEVISYEQSNQTDISIMRMWCVWIYRGFTGHHHFVCTRVYYNFFSFKQRTL